MKIRNSLLVFLCLVSTSSFARIQLPPMFSDGMVLQQQSEAPIWGKAIPNKDVKVITSWDGKNYTIKSATDGSWSLKVQTPKAGGPYSITISDGKPIKLNDVLIGEVWICSGQSNMEMPLEGWGKVQNYKQEIQTADYPNIRLLQVEKETNSVPVADIKVRGGGWQACSPQTVAEFSAVAYFFGRNLHQNLNVPIGLINTSWGGTIAETWTSGESLVTMPDFKDAVEQVKNRSSKEGQIALYQKQMTEWDKKVAIMDHGYENKLPVWALQRTKDEDWKTMKVPGVIQNQGLKDFHGIVWFRKEVNIPAEWNGKDLILNLGPIDDNDITFFNGVEIGHTEGYSINRTYKIPARLVKKGEAVIAVRVFDTGGDGGINGPSENVYIQAKSGERQVLAGDWKYNKSLELNEMPAMPENTFANPNFPTLLYNAMLHPLIPYAIRGAIWYQGESNADRSYQYRELFPLMINDWRNKWKRDFPFYFVQLANFTKLQTEPEESAWAELREAQFNTLRLENTGMAVTIDIGEANDIHPKNKQEVGRRLALAARSLTYGEKVVYSGPLYQSYKIEGNKIRIKFNHTDGGLKAKDGALKGFTIAGVDHKFHWADAVIDGDDVIVYSTDVTFPIAVRYAWANNPICNLFNGAGLPASPFRTDDWQGTTSGKK